MKSPALFQLQPKVTGFASFSQLLLGNANADADSSTSFLCGTKTTTLSQALFQKLCGRREPTLLSKKPDRNFRAVRHNTTTKSIWKTDFPHLRALPAQASPCHPLFPTWMRVGFEPVLCSAYVLLATGCLRLLSSSGLHCSQALQASPATPWAPEPQLMSLGSYRRLQPS